MSCLPRQGFILKPPVGSFKILISHSVGEELFNPHQLAADPPSGSAGVSYSPQQAILGVKYGMRVGARSTSGAFVFFLLSIPAG